MIKIDGVEYNTIQVLTATNIIGILSVALFLLVNSLFLIGTFIAVASMVLIMPFMIIDDIFRLIKKAFKDR